MRFFQSISIILLSIFLVVGCSSKPFESDVKSEIEQKIQKNSNGLIKLIDFKKTNGIERQIPLVAGTFYTMEWVANIEFTGDCIFDSLGYYARPASQADLENVWNKMNNNSPHRKGERLNISDRTNFEKTENGWRITHNF